MRISRTSTLCAAVLLTLTSGAMAGPLSVAGAEAVAAAAQPQAGQAQAEKAAYRHYRRHRHYHHRYGRHHYRYYSANPGAAVAGAALGLLSLPFAAAGAFCDPYYYGCGGPYYGGYGPYYRRYGYWGGHRYAGYHGGIYTGRSVGYGGWHGGRHR